MLSLFSHRLFALTCLVACLLLSACQPAAEEPTPPPVAELAAPAPADVGPRIIDDLLARDDYMIYRANHFTGIHYAEAAAGYAAIRLADYLDDETRLHQLLARYETVPGTDSLKEADHVDASVYGILPLQIYMTYGDEAKWDEGLDLADHQWEDPLPEGLTHQSRFWIDDVWMVGSLQVQAYRSTQDTTYLDRAAVEADVYLQQLQQPNGLFYHGPEAPFFWGRGNGWVAAGLAEILSELPPDHPRHAAILAGYRKMMDALLLYQAEDGMWRQLINEESAWKETSSTAMFGYAMATGVRRGLLPEDAFRPAYRQAWTALTGYLNAEGQLTDVCVGTGQSQDIQYYLDRPRSTGDLHGQVPTLWFAHSLLVAGETF